MSRIGRTIAFLRIGQALWRPVRADRAPNSRDPRQRQASKAFVEPPITDRQIEAAARIDSQPERPVLAFFMLRRSKSIGQLVSFRFTARAHPQVVVRPDSGRQSEAIARVCTSREQLMRSPCVALSG